MGSEVPLRLLVVDNDELVCAVTTEMLESLGHRADCETDSLNALKVFSENPDEFDLAIIEPVLPDLMGLDLAIRFRHIRPGFPVLFYAGYVDASLSPSNRSRGPRAGSLFKPSHIESSWQRAIRDRLSGPEANARSCFRTYSCVHGRKALQESIIHPSHLVKRPAKWRYERKRPRGTHPGMLLVAISPFLTKDCCQIPLPAQGGTP